MTKVDIFSGFLGAGKTTLIKKLIKEAFTGEKLVLIENEFGEIGVDGGFLADAGINVTEMNSGCICCSLVGDFATALCKVLDEYAPDRILIEPSGVGKLSDVVRAVREAAPDRLEIAGLVTVADAAKCRMHLRNFGEFFGDQLASAGTVIFSHVKGLSPEKLHAAVEAVRAHNGDAIIVTTDWDSLTGAQILAAMEKTDTLAAELSRLQAEAPCPVCGHHHEHHHDHEEECDCHGHHHHGEECHHDHGHHHHDEECCHHDHGHHHHDEDCCHDHGHHHPGEDCDCGCHDHGHHHHDEECCHDHEHHHHDEECCHHDHGHHHGEECCHHEHEHHHHDEECCHEHGHHHADEVFVSCGAETTKRFDKEALHAALKALTDGATYGNVLRAKGIVAGEGDAWLHFDYVPAEPDVRDGAPAIIGRLCVIGADLNIPALSALFGVDLK